MKQKTLRQIYSKNSFYIWSLNSKFRKFLIGIIESKYFQYLIRFFLFVNTLAFIIKYDYDYARDSSVWNYKVSFYIELVCNFFFLLELMIRILVMGLILERKTFLRDAFQILDFLVTFARFFQCCENISIILISFIQYASIPQLENFGNVLKMLRPFRLFASYPRNSSFSFLLI